MRFLLKFIKMILILFVSVILFVSLLFRWEETTCVDNVFKCVDERLGIERGDYRIRSRAARLFVLQDPVALQKIILNKKGREQIEKYISHYQDTLQRLSIPKSVHLDYEPRFDKSNCRLSNSLPNHANLKMVSEIIEDSEAAYIRLQTSQVGRYFEQYCWLGGDYWKIIVDREEGIIYREYGSI